MWRLEDFSVFDSRRNSVRKGTLFLMKGIAMLPESASGIFLFETQEFKGIQVGSPGNRQKHFSMELFGGDAKLLITFSNPANGAGSFSQEDANRVAQSMNKIETPMSVMFPNAPEKAKTVDCFRALTKEISIYTVVQKCGPPDEELGSGIYIFVWHLPDGSSVNIGTPYLRGIGEIRYTDRTGNTSILLHAK